jgi:hypothetical protein
MHVLFFQHLIVTEMVKECPLESKDRDIRSCLGQACTSIIVFIVRDPETGQSPLSVGMRNDQRSQGLRNWTGWMT